MPLLLIVLLLFLVPWVGIIVLVMFGVFALLAVTLGFAANSFVWLLAGPTQLFRILFNHRVRKNHAIEHATVHILEDRFGRMNIEGMAEEGGFSLRGLRDRDVVAMAARSALERLKRGEIGLAIHPRCGTTLVVLNTLASVLFLSLLALTGSFSLLTVIVSLLLAHAAAPLASRFAQKYVTTDSRVDGMEILSVEMRGEKVALSGFSFIVPGSLFVRTRFSGDPLLAEVVD